MHVLLANINTSQALSDLKAFFLESTKTYWAPPHAKHGATFWSWEISVVTRLMGHIHPWLPEEALHFPKASLSKGALTSGHHLLRCELPLCLQSASEVLLTVSVHRNFQGRLEGEAWTWRPRGRKFPTVQPVPHWWPGSDQSLILAHGKFPVSFSYIITLTQQLPLHPILSQIPSPHLLSLKMDFWSLYQRYWEAADRRKKRGFSLPAAWGGITQPTPVGKAGRATTATVWEEPVPSCSCCSERPPLAWPPVLWLFGPALHRVMY